MGITILHGRDKRRTRPEAGSPNIDVNDFRGMDTEYPYLILLQHNDVIGGLSEITLDDTQIQELLKYLQETT